MAGLQNFSCIVGAVFFFAARRGHLYYILAEGAIALSVTLSGGALFAS